MRFSALLFLFLAPLAAHAVNDFWVGRSYSVVLNFGAADLGKQSAPRPDSVPLPEFPGDFMFAGVSGEVVLDFTVEADGRLSDLRIVKASSEELSASATAATHSWKFKPAISVREGTPIQARMRCRIQFLTDEDTGSMQMPAPRT